MEIAEEYCKLDAHFLFHFTVLLFFFLFFFFLALPSLFFGFGCNSD